MTEQCSTCKYGQTDGTQYGYFCRRFPPLHQGGLIWFWPRVDGSAWCGCWAGADQWEADRAAELQKIDAHVAAHCQVSPEVFSCATDAAEAAGKRLFEENHAAKSREITELRERVGALELERDELGELFDSSEADVQALTEERDTADGDAKRCLAERDTAVSVQKSFLANERERADKAMTEATDLRENLRAADARGQNLHDLLVKLCRIVDQHEAYPLKFDDLPEAFERIKAARDTANASNDRMVVTLHKLRRAETERDAVRRNWAAEREKRDKTEERVEELAEKVQQLGVDRDEAQARAEMYQVHAETNASFFKQLEAAKKRLTNRIEDAQGHVCHALTVMEHLFPELPDCYVAALRPAEAHLRCIRDNGSDPTEAPQEPPEQG